MKKPVRRCAYKYTQDNEPLERHIEENEEYQFCFSVGGRTDELCSM